MGADESLPHPDGPYPFDLDTIATATVATWAIHPDDADATVTRANTAGIPISPLEALSRRTPDGALLSWRLTQPTAGPLPFIIDWQGSVSPAASTQARADCAVLPFVYLSPKARPRKRRGLRIRAPNATGGSWNRHRN